MDKFLIVDDHPVVLDGLRLLLSDLLPGGEFITANSGRKAMAMADRNPDLDWIFMDVNLPDADGIDLLRQLESRQSTAYVVVLSSDNSPAIADRALNQSASGFLSKSFDQPELRRCIRTIERGQIYLDADLRLELNNYRESVLAEKKHIEASLTQRQRQTLLYLAQGYSNREIAKSFDVTESTVKSHVQALMALFEADNRTHCVSEAGRLNII
ncbi:MAG: response regulator transcription factor [Pseudomonadota bacterium]